MALETNVWLVYTSTVAVFVAAALRGAVVSNKTKVTLAHSGGHACSIHTALCTHWLTLTRNTRQKKKIMVDISNHFEAQTSFNFNPDLSPAEYITMFAGAVVSLR